MKTEKKRRKQTFLVLVPHRDVRGEFRKYGDLMVKAGLTDVYSFPYVAPVASLSRALSAGELKQIANSLRKNIGSGKISTEGDAVTAFPCDDKNLTLSGPCLNISIPQNVFESGIKKINALFSPLVIGCFLTKDNKKLISLPEIKREKLAFRAAAVANMYWQTLEVNGEIYYKWKIGKLYWLPRPQKGLQKTEMCNNKIYEGQKTP
ncbi:hypothetical protein R84B8_01056 [Treponema sp. R8-4-B8]